MEGRIVIVAYKPKAGKAEMLKNLMHSHYKILKEQDLVSDRKPIMMEGKNEIIIEVFEWKSAEAITAAHSNEAVQKMWTDYMEACEFVPLNTLQEATNMFAEFAPFE